MPRNENPPAPGATVEALRKRLKGLEKSYENTDYVNLSRLFAVTHQAFALLDTERQRVDALQRTVEGEAITRAALNDHDCKVEALVAERDAAEKRATEAERERDHHKEELIAWHREHDNVWRTRLAAGMLTQERDALQAQLREMREVLVDVRSSFRPHRTTDRCWLRVDAALNATPAEALARVEAIADEHEAGYLRGWSEAMEMAAKLMDETAGMKTVAAHFRALAAIGPSKGSKE